MALYERTVATFWVVKGILAGVLMDRNAKNQGDKELVRAWKEHNADSLLMHWKIDIIASELWFCIPLVWV